MKAMNTGSDNDAPRPGPRLAVLSYNIRHGAGVDGQVDLGRTAAVIRAARPDLVALQEVDQGTRRSGAVDQAHELARRTGLSVVFGASMDFDGGRYGNAVLSRLPMEDPARIRLPGEPRSALCVRVTLAAGTRREARFTFVATHLDTAEGPRLESPALIERFFADGADAPAVLAGDFNAAPRSPALQAFGRTWENATARGGLLTFPAPHPVEQIDYVMYRPAHRWLVVETRVVEEAVASDHRPILAVLEWCPAPGEPPD